MDFAPVKNSSQLVFRQWSHKAYAVFQSIGREVIIAGLCSYLENVFIPKIQKSLNAFTDLLINTISTNTDIDELQEVNQLTLNKKLNPIVIRIPAYSKNIEKNNLHYR